MSYTRFSGFAPRQIEGLSALLTRKGISFEIFADLQAYQELELEYQSEGAHRGRMSFDPHHISFDIEEADVEKLDEECAAAGFSHFDPDQVVDHQLESEDYLCPKCDHCDFQPGQCPTHGLPLLSFSQWNEVRRGREAASSRRLWIIGAALISALLLIVLMTK